MPGLDQGQQLFHAEKIITAQAAAIEKLAATVEAQNTTIHVLSGTIERMLGTPESPVDELAEQLAPAVREARLRDAVAQSRFSMLFDTVDGDTQAEITKIVEAVTVELDNIANEEATDGR